MLAIQKLSYRIAGRPIFTDASVNIMDGWKVGIVGANGAGKSTLFKLISKELQADSGVIELSERQTFGMVRQDIPSVDTPILEIVIQAHEELHHLMKAADTETDPYKIGEIHMRLAELDAWAAPARAAMLLTGLGFREDQLQLPFNSLSGGWRMRVALAAALFVQPDLLLLDEPTNHLDLEAIMWLEDYLVSYPNTLLIISHDRELLNKCVDHVVHVEQQTLTLYTGNYDSFERERAQKRMHQQSLFEKQQTQRAHMQEFINRFKAKASKARQAQSRLRALEKMELVDAVIAERSVRFKFPRPDALKSPLMTLDRVSVGYSPNEPVLSNVSFNVDMDDRIALMGANGNGKSTLIKLIAGKLEALSGSVLRSSKLKIGYFSQHQTEELDVKATPYQAMYRRMVEKEGSAIETNVRARLGQFYFTKQMSDQPIENLSGGEKARLLFALMSFDAPHILLLDEPTNHLDIEAREALINALNSFEGAVIMVSHDPSMVERVADQLWLVHGGTCQPFDGDLDEYRRFVIENRRAEKRQEKAAKKAAEPSNPAQKPNQKAVNPSNLRKKLDKLEAELKTLNEQKIELETRMAAPHFYQKPAAETRETQAQYETLKKTLETKEKDWLDTQEALEDLPPQ